MKKNKPHIILFSLILSFFLLTISAYAASTGYTPLASIPATEGLSSGTTNGTLLSTYLKEMYKFGVGIATALAVLMVIWGGVEYVTTDAIGGKEEGKERIQNAILGLLLALGSYLILQTINPNLLNTSLNPTVVTVTSAVSSGATAAGSVSNTNAWANWTSTDQTAFDSAYTHGVDPTGMTSDQMKAAGLSDTEINAVNKETTAQNSYNGVSSGTSSNESGTLSNNSAIKKNDNGSYTLTTGTLALDTDGTTNPGIDPTTHQSQTSYTINGKSLDSTKDNYVVVPDNSPIPLGSSVVVTNTSTGVQTTAIVGDHGGEQGYGEISVATANSLGIYNGKNSISGNLKFEFLNK